MWELLENRGRWNCSNTVVYHRICNNDRMIVVVFAGTETVVIVFAEIRCTVSVFLERPDFIDKKLSFLPWLS